MARLDDRAYREYVREQEQRSQPGCPARELCHELRGPDTGQRAGRSTSAGPPFVSTGGLLPKEREKPVNSQLPIPNLQVKRFGSWELAV